MFLGEWKIFYSVRIVKKYELCLSFKPLKF